MSFRLIGMAVGECGGATVSRGCSDSEYREKCPFIEF